MMHQGPNRTRPALVDWLAGHRRQAVIAGGIVLIVAAVFAGAVLGFSGSGGASDRPGVAASNGWVSGPGAVGQPADPRPATSKTSGKSTVNGGLRTMCGYLERATVSGAQARYKVENDNYGGQAECVQTNGGPWFRVSKSAAVKYEWQGFPLIWRGCSWGSCSPGSGMPRQVWQLQHPWVTWHTKTAGVGGRWSAAIDLWFSRRDSGSGPYDAELMIWLNEQAVGSLTGAPVYALSGANWQFTGWRTAPHPWGQWNYLQFRRLGATGRVDHLALKPFIDRAVAMGKISKSWYLVAIEAGFEIVQDGTGLTTTRFEASP